MTCKKRLVLSMLCNFRTVNLTCPQLVLIRLGLRRAGQIGKFTLGVLKAYGKLNPGVVRADNSLTKLFGIGYVWKEVMKFFGGNIGWNWSTRSNRIPGTQLRDLLCFKTTSTIHWVLIFDLNYLTVCKQFIFFVPTDPMTTKSNHLCS